MTRECQPAGHYNEEKGGRWSNNNITVCKGAEEKQLSCSGVALYGNWAQWSKCTLSCVYKDWNQSIRTRKRNCNDTITNSGKFINQNKHSKNLQAKHVILQNKLKRKFANVHSAKMRKLSYAMCRCYRRTYRMQCFKKLSFRVIFRTYH